VGRPRVAPQAPAVTALRAMTGLEPAEVAEVARTLGTRLVGPVGPVEPAGTPSVVAADAVGLRRPARAVANAAGEPNGLTVLGRAAVVSG